MDEIHTYFSLDSCSETTFSFACTENPNKS